jgi:hypothetical protein
MMKSCRPKHFRGSLSQCEVSVRVKGGSQMNEDAWALHSHGSWPPKVWRKSRKSAAKRSRFQRCLSHWLSHWRPDRRLRLKLLMLKTRKLFFRESPEKLVSVSALSLYRGMVSPIKVMNSTSGKFSEVHRSVERQNKENEFRLQQFESESKKWKVGNVIHQRHC